MADLRRPRWATEADNAALIALNRACPVAGTVEMVFDRAPDFFALSRLQGTGAKVCAVDAPEPGALHASAALADFPALFVDGEPRPVMYACDLRVHPDARGGRTVKRIYDFMTAYGVEEVGRDLGVTTIMKDNAAMAAVLQGKGGVVPYVHATTMRNFTIQFALPKRPISGITTRAATAADWPDMVALWNRVQATKHFAPVWGDDTRRWLESAPGIDVSSYRLAFRKDRLVGLLLLWDQEAFKRMVVLGYAPSMVRMRRWYNPLAAVLGLARIPDVGGRLPYAYATQPCAEDVAAMRALYVHAYNERRNPSTLFLSTMLDLKDPLLGALEGFITQHVDIELYMMDPHRRHADLARRVCYFDPSLV